MSKVNKEFGYTNEVYKVENIKSRFNLVNTAGDVLSSSDSTIVGSSMRKRAATQGKAVRGHINKNGVKTYRMVEMQEYTDMLVKPMNTDIAETIVENPTEHKDVIDFIHKDGMQ
jgi:hypothetical protein